MTDIDKRVRELEEAIRDESPLTIVLDPGMLRALLSERRRHVAALEWYADADQYRYDDYVGGNYRALEDGGSRAQINLGWIPCESCHRLVPPNEIVKHRPANWDGTDDDVATYQCPECVDGSGR